jgi:hypothetical protein
VSHTIICCIVHENPPRQARPILGTRELAAPRSNCAVFGRKCRRNGGAGRGRLRRPV